MIQGRNLQVGDLVFITDQLTAHSQYPLARIIQVQTDHHSVVCNVPIMTAIHNKLRPDLQPERTTFERDTMALIEYPEINHATETIYER